MLASWPWSVVLKSIIPRLIAGLLSMRPVGISWRMDETYIIVPSRITILIALGPIRLNEKGPANARFSIDNCLQN